ncbi:hypothetical protein B0H17DRAFT_1038291 [Mycena rosella]|uniref:Mitochondrial import inner membrane translocase subunit TIM50 n=1 Tax=Mycena rosella TaxID=1033263 RepID=A0AAD7GUI4_MYCRO|nr:hypothetical protein B0H17DRAFT_1038291 [Mycena rosella]
MSIQAPRKLLILDLNGTLLLRSKHARGAPHLGIRPRTVYPRPFLGPFREYIFHSSTMAWLDTMVWSSAQPPSVADMVNHCFGDHQHKFLAIWARDTLGIPPELYHRKTQTTKDLRTPWGAFPAHDVRTTVLLDDSVRKAHLHPNNHVCVLEYLQETRARDLVVWQTSEFGGALSEKPKKKRRSNKKQSVSAEDAVLDSAVHLASAPPTKYDETLLAVVGILETLKTEGNVAEWMRGGGLLADTAAGNTVEQMDKSPDSLASQMAGLTVAATQPLWFTSEPVVRHWVGVGVHALEALRIDVVPGIQGEISPARQR